MANTVQGVREKFMVSKKELELLLFVLSYFFVIKCNIFEYGPPSSVTGGAVLTSLSKWKYNLMAELQMGAEDSPERI